MSIQMEDSKNSGDDDEPTTAAISSSMSSLMYFDSHNSLDHRMCNRSVSLFNEKKCSMAIVDNSYWPSFDSFICKKISRKKSSNNSSSNYTPSNCSSSSISSNMSLKYTPQSSDEDEYKSIMTNNESEEDLVELEVDERDEEVKSKRKANTFDTKEEMLMTKKKAKKTKKKIEWRDMTKELVMVRVRRNAINDPNELDEPSVNQSFSNDNADDYSMTRREEDEKANDFYFSSHGYEELVQRNLDLLKSKAYMSRFNMGDMDKNWRRIDSSTNLTTTLCSVGCLRHTKSRKRIKLKTLLKRDNVTSLCLREHTPLLSHSSLYKNNVALHVKYHVYVKLVDLQSMSYVSMRDRCLFQYAPKRIDKNKTISSDELRSNKKIYRLLGDPNNYDYTDNNGRRQQPATDSRVVINNSLDRNRMNSELNQTYDDMYVEFLISLQHREITPEDYEHLSRLDEMVKKKTASENIVKNLRNEKPDDQLIESWQREETNVCGICLESYVAGVSVTYLPCAHKFHSDCIVSWLTEHANCCPLDKIAVDAPLTIDTNTTDKSSKSSASSLESNVGNVSTRNSYINDYGFNDDVDDYDEDMILNQVLEKSRLEQHSMSRSAQIETNAEDESSILNCLVDDMIGRVEEICKLNYEKRNDLT